MKKFVIACIILLLLALSACSRTDPSGKTGGTLPVITLHLREEPSENRTGRPEAKPDIVEGEALSEEEVLRLKEFLNWNVDRIPCMFLTCSYEKPEEIDFDLVFYNGTVSGAIMEPVSLQEREEVARILGVETVLERNLPPQKRPRAKVEALIRQYTGLPEETVGQIVLSYPYVAEYDAYYTFFDDCESIRVKVRSVVWTDEAHTLAQVVWSDSVRGREGIAMMEKTEDGWRFLSNWIAG